MHTMFDFTRPISESTHPFPGDMPVVLKQETTVAQHRFATRTVTMPSHIATHLDAPAHVFAEGKTLDAFPLERFFGVAYVVYLPGLKARTPISVDMFWPHERFFHAGARVLLRTDWEKTAARKKEDFFQDAPFLTPEAARWLAARKLGLLGMDVASLDPLNSTDPLRCHQILLEAEILLLENLVGLDAVPPQKPFFLSALPLSLEKAEGAPVRAAGMKITEITEITK